MSSMDRDHGIFSRMACLPRSIINGRRRRQSRNQNDMSSSSSLESQLYDPTVVRRDDQWAFLESLDNQYGTLHPFFYTCRLMEALKIAEEERKMVFMYIHSAQHPFTHSFCRETLCSEVVTEFLDVNFVCWGGFSDRGEGMRMVATLHPSCYPLCAVVAPAVGDSMAVLKQIEGPVSAAELVEILQRTMEEQGLAFGSDRARREEMIRADRRLREEQDAAYLASLTLDKDKEKLKNSTSPTQRVPVEAILNNKTYEKPKNKPKVNQPTTTTPNQNRGVPNGVGQSQPTQILIRFPNGERRGQRFECTDKIQAIFVFIDSLGLPGIDNYRLVSNFPRRVYSVDQMRITLKDAGLHPKATLFLEPIPADP